MSSESEERTADANGHYDCCGAFVGDSCFDWCFRATGDGKVRAEYEQMTKTAPPGFEPLARQRIHAAKEKIAALESALATERKAREKYEASCVEWAGISGRAERACSDRVMALEAERDALKAERDEIEKQSIERADIIAKIGTTLGAFGERVSEAAVRVVAERDRLRSELTAHDQMRAEVVAALDVEVTTTRSQVRALQELLGVYVLQFAGIHTIPNCPEDGPCECPLVRRVNEMLAHSCPVDNLETLASAAARARTLEAEVRRKDEALRLARSLCDKAAGDTDMPEDDRPVVRACQILSAALSPSPEGRSEALLIRAQGQLRDLKALLTAAEARDAALEEAAKVFDARAESIEANARDPRRPNIGCTQQECLDAARGERNTAEEIRALKSTPDTAKAESPAPDNEARMRAALAEIHNDFLPKMKWAIHEAMETFHNEGMALVRKGLKRPTTPEPQEGK